MGESTATLALVIKAKDMASGQVNKLNKSLTGLKSGVLDSLPLGFMGAAGAAALLTDQLVKGVKGAIEEEQSIARLGQVLQANIPAWDGNTEAVLDRLDAGLKLGFADDQLRDSMAKLLPATKDVNEALRLQRTAMDLARLKGIDLKDASQALVKVEGGQYRLLKELGIVLKDGATQTEALAEVQKVAAGQAEAYMETTAGKLERLDNAWQDLTETVGGMAVPVLEDSADYVQALSDAMSEGELTATEYRQDIEALAGALDAIAPEFLDNAMAAFRSAAAVEENAQKAGELIVQSTIATNKVRGLTGALDTVTERSALWREESSRARTSNAKTGKSFDALSDDILQTYRYATTFAGMNAGSYGQDFWNPNVNPAQRKNKKKRKKHAAGGWVGLTGPEEITVGERGPEYVTPNHQLGSPGRNGGGGVMIQGVSERELMDMVDRQLYFRLRRKPS